MAKLLLDDLPEADRQNILDTIETLRHSDPSQWPQDKVVRVWDDPPRYMLRPTPSLRLFLKHNEQNELEIADLLREELYQWLHGSSNGANQR
jgi:hypothetical protein